MGLSAWSLQAGLQPRQHEHLVEDPEAMPCHKKPVDTQGRCGDLTRRPGTLTRTEDLTPTGLVQAGASGKPGTVLWSGQGIKDCECECTCLKKDEAKDGEGPSPAQATDLPGFDTALSSC